MSNGAGLARSRHGWPDRSAFAQRFLLWARPSAGKMGVDMLRRNGSSDDRIAGTGQRGMFSVIGTDVTVTGNITATADLHIDGRIDGDVTCAALVQGPDSRISGSVRADSARISGRIEGSVAGRQLTVERSAVIVGDVEYQEISVETGAQIDGRLKRAGADMLLTGPGDTTTVQLVSVGG
jgi:cytoskeletal protein CcmA (bactofilin family)